MELSEVNCNCSLPKYGTGTFEWRVMCSSTQSIFIIVSKSDCGSRERTTDMIIVRLVIFTLHLPASNRNNTQRLGLKF